MMWLAGQTVKASPLASFQEAKPFRPIQLVDLISLIYLSIILQPSLFLNVNIKFVKLPDVVDIIVRDN